MSTTLDSAARAGAAVLAGAASSERCCRDRLAWPGVGLLLRVLGQRGRMGGGDLISKAPGSLIGRVYHGIRAG